jgi:hypothetical protein
MISFLNRISFYPVLTKSVSTKNADSEINPISIWLMGLRNGQTHRWMDWAQVDSRSLSPPQSLSSQPLGKAWKIRPETHKDPAEECPQDQP